MAIKDYTLYQQSDFAKLGDCIGYYQDYQLTKHKYHNRRKALAYFDNVSLEKIRKHHIKKYHLLRSAVVSSATVNREISFARAAINCVNRDFELSIYNPFEDIKFNEVEYLPNYLTVEQYEILLDTCLSHGYHDLHDFIVLLTMTGCRPVEIKNLAWVDVHLEKRFFIVRNCWSKNKRMMYKYLNDTAIQLLEKRQENKIGEWVFTNRKTGKAIGSYQKIFNKVKADLSFNCSFYDLRHTYASWLVQRSVSIYTVKELLGHRDIASTMRYAHLDYSTYCNALSNIG